MVKSVISLLALLSVTSSAWLGVKIRAGSPAPWGLSGGGSWSYRRALTVENPAGNGALSNFQVQVSTDVHPTTFDAADPSLKGLWHFDESSGNAADSSGNGLTLTATNGPAFASARMNNGASFTAGAAQHFVTSGNPAALQITGNLTVEAWIYPTDCTNRPGILGKRTGTDGTAGYSLDCYLNQVRFILGNGSTATVAYSAANSVPHNTWTHVAGVVSGTTLQAYVNGQASGSPVTFTGTRQNPAIGLYVGRFYSTDTAGFAGKIDEVRIYNRALSAQEIADHAGLTYGLNSGLLASYHFNETAGTTSGALQESSGNSMNATMSGFAAPYGTISGGRFGGALSCDGVNDSITSTTYDMAANAPFTFSIWFYQTASVFDQFQTLVQHAFDGNSGPWFGAESSGHERTLTFYGSPAYLYSNTQHTLNVWNHGAATFDGTTVKLYLNGALVGSGNHTFPAANRGFGLCGTWAGIANYYFAGYIDEPLIYTRALSASEIAELAKDPTAAAAASRPKIRPDLGDLRFSTTPDATSEVPFWLESDKRAWVKIPSVSTGANTALYLFYGNMNAALGGSFAHSGGNTFIAFSDASDVASWVGGGVSAVSNELFVNKSGAVAATRPVSLAGNWVLETKFRRATSSNANMYIITGDGSGSAFAANRNTMTYVDAGSTSWSYYNAGTPTVLYTSNAIGTYYISKEVRHGTTYDHLLFDAKRLLLASALNANFSGVGTAPNTVTGIQLASGSGAWTMQVYVPWMLVRSYAATEPTAHAGPEVSF